MQHGGLLLRRRRLFCGVKTVTGRSVECAVPESVLSDLDFEHLLEDERSVLVGLWGV